MKKAVIYGILTTAFAIGGFLVSQNYNTTELTETQLANIEALSDGEDGDLVVKCYCKDKLFSPNVCSASGDGAYCGGDPCPNHDGNCR